MTRVLLVLPLRLLSLVLVLAFAATAATSQSSQTGPFPDNAVECVESEGMVVFSDGIATGCVWPQNYPYGFVVSDRCVIKTDEKGVASLHCGDETITKKNGNDETLKSECPKDRTCS